MAILQEALQRSRNGDVKGAVDLLLSAPELDKNGLALLFTLLRAQGAIDEAIGFCAQRLDEAKNDAECSLWSLRRALLYLDKQEHKAAQRDLTAVLRFNANEDHAEQARNALLRTVDRSKKARA